MTPARIGILALCIGLNAALAVADPETPPGTTPPAAGAPASVAPVAGAPNADSSEDVKKFLNKSGRERTCDTGFADLIEPSFGNTFLLPNPKDDDISPFGIFNQGVEMGRWARDRVNNRLREVFKQSNPINVLEYGIQRKTDYLTKSLFGETLPATDEFNVEKVTQEFDEILKSAKGFPEKMKRLLDEEEQTRRRIASIDAELTDIQIGSLPLDRVVKLPVVKNGALLPESETFRYTNATDLKVLKGGLEKRLREMNGWKAKENDTYKNAAANQVINLNALKVIRNEMLAESERQVNQGKKVPQEVLNWVAQIEQLVSRDGKIAPDDMPPDIAVQKVKWQQFGDSIKGAFKTAELDRFAKWYESIPDDIKKASGTDRLEKFWGYFKAGKVYIFGTTAAGGILAATGQNPVDLSVQSFDFVSSALTALAATDYMKQRKCSRLDDADYVKCVSDYIKSKFLKEFIQEMTKNNSGAQEDSSHTQVIIDPKKVPVEGDPSTKENSFLTRDGKTGELRIHSSLSPEFSTNYVGIRNDSKTGEMIINPKLLAGDDSSPVQKDPSGKIVVNARTIVEKGAMRGMIRIDPKTGEVKLNPAIENEIKKISDLHTKNQRYNNRESDIDALIGQFLSQQDYGSDSSIDYWVYADPPEFKKRLLLYFRTKSDTFYPAIEKYLIALCDAAVADKAQQVREIYRISPTLGGKACDIINKRENNQVICGTNTGFPMGGGIIGGGVPGPIGGDKNDPPLPRPGPIGPLLKQPPHN